MISIPTSEPARPGGAFPLLRVWCWRVVAFPLVATVMEHRVLCIWLTVANAVQAGLVLFGLPGWTCAFHSLTGLSCPGCGLTRALVGMLHGAWEEALVLHPFAPFFGAFCMAVALASVAPDNIRSRIIQRVSWFECRTGVTGIILLGFAVHGLTRMALFR